MKQQLDNDLGLEMPALTILRPGIRTCMEAADDGSRELLEHILVDEEKHVDWIEAQLHQIMKSAIRIIWLNRSKRLAGAIYAIAASFLDLQQKNYCPTASWGIRTYR